MLLRVLTAGSLAALWWLAIKARAGARLRFPLAFIVIACLAPLHLLLRSRQLPAALSALGGSLPAAGDSDGVRGKRSRARRDAGTLLAFHFAALQHKLNSWEHASEATRAACATAAAHQRPALKLAALGLPRKIHGVPSFANGFGDCVEILNRRPAAVEVDRGRDAGRYDAQTVLLIWDDARERLVCAKSCE